MQYYFELYITSDQLTSAHWKKLYRALLQYGGLFGKFEIVFRCTDNVVRFFVGSNQDIGTLSNNIEGFLLRPVDAQELTPPEATAKEGFVNFVAGGNLLDLKEKYAVQKTKELSWAVFTVRAINAEKSIVRCNLYFMAPGNLWSRAKKTMLTFPAHLLAVDFANNTRYLKKSMPVYLDIEKSLHMLTNESSSGLFQVDTFPYFSHPYYLNLTSYEFDKHSFIIGATGSGKSKLIGLLVDRLYNTPLKMNYRVVIIDPHASLGDDFAHIPDARVMNFNSESTELFSESATDISAATELTATLFKSLLADQFNARLDRTLRFTLFVLLTAQNMSLDTLKRFLTDVELRNQVMNHVTGYVPQNIVQFFGADFNDIRTKYYNDAILPIISLIDELQLQPSLSKGGDISLARTIQDNFLTVFSLNKVSMGEKTVKTIAGLLIQQIFLLVQARIFGQKIILIVDEVSVVQNPALASILAEARKFGLSVVLTQQYFGQIEKDLRDAIFANVYNYYVFKVSEEDARALEGNLNIVLPKELAEAEHQKGHKEADVRVKIMTELHPRECLVRLSANGQINPCIKARTVDAPVASQATPATTRLTHYEQTLPSKFVEGAGAAKPEPPTPQTPQLTAAPVQTPPDSAPSTRGFSLSELLSQHSSSRIKVNKRKD